MYLGSTDRTEQGSAFLSRLQVTDPYLFQPKPGVQSVSPDRASETAPEFAPIDPELAGVETQTVHAVENAVAEAMANVPTLTQVDAERVRI